MPGLFEHDPCGGLFFGVVLLALGYFISGRNDRTWALAMRVTAVAYVLLIAAEGLAAKPRPDRIEIWIKAAVMGLVPATYVMAVSLMAITLLSFLHDRLVVRPGRAWRRWRDDARYARMREKEARELERQRARQQLEWERDAPRREAAARQAAEQERLRAGHQLRREDARAQALREYRKYAARLKDRMFDRKDFDLYVEKYMGDGQPADVVERRGRELVASFEEMLREERPPKKEQSLADLTEWYRREKAQIDSLDMDEVVKETALAALATRYQELMDRHLEGMQP